MCTVDWSTEYRTIDIYREGGEAYFLFRPPVVILFDDKLVIFEEMGMHRAERNSRCI